ncbi:TIR domain-containing protein [uncultured Thiodictyon sp.]|uniref:TIR domain-containing protein n=1 Tax=uncultured Thiodictyon sp. TaxID=1846217 RepID=UPI0025D83819|nr:TIR domain-containing protein [uncultured Thiodictyon sp.]
MTRAFISYSTKDLAFVVSCLKPILDGRGVVTWCSGTDVRVAADWERQIRTALVQTDWFIVVLSPDAQQSEWVQSETHWALEHLRGRVIPVMARGCDPCQLHLRLGTIQYIDFRTNPVRAGAQLLALIDGNTAGQQSSAHLFPAPAGLDAPTVIRKTRQADIKLFLELPSLSGVERSHRIDRSAIIGRADDADVQIADDCVSRKHARITVLPADQGVCVTLSDLDSANGTFVNDRRITTEQRLEVGDLITMGNARFRLLAIDEPGAARG